MAILNFEKPILNSKDFKYTRCGTAFWVGKKFLSYHFWILLWLSLFFSNCKILQENPGSFLMTFISPAWCFYICKCFDNFSKAPWLRLNHYFFNLLHKTGFVSRFFLQWAQPDFCDRPRANQAFRARHGLCRVQRRAHPGTGGPTQLARHPSTPSTAQLLLHGQFRFPHRADHGAPQQRRDPAGMPQGFVLGESRIGLLSAADAGRRAPRRLVRWVFPRVDGAGGRGI